MVQLPDRTVCVTPLSERRGRCTGATGICAFTSTTVWRPRPASPSYLEEIGRDPTGIFWG